MPYVDLLGTAGDAGKLQEFAKKFLIAFGVEHFEERSSSSYVEGLYYLAFKNDVEIKISIYDGDDHEDLPFWVHFYARVLKDSDLVNMVDTFVRDVAIPGGFRFARFLKLGRKASEVRLEY